MYSHTSRRVEYGTRVLHGRKYSWMTRRFDFASKIELINIVKWYLWIPRRRWRQHKRSWGDSGHWECRDGFHSACRSTYGDPWTGSISNLRFAACWVHRAEHWRHGWWGDMLHRWWRQGLCIRFSPIQPLFGIWIAQSNPLSKFMYHYLSRLINKLIKSVQPYLTRFVHVLRQHRRSWGDSGTVFSSSYSRDYTSYCYSKV